MNIIYVFRVMRLVALLLFCGFLQLSAASYSQEITLKGNNIPLVSVFKSISQQTGYEVAGFEISLDKAKPVTVSAEQMPIKDFLQLIFYNQPFTYKIEGRTIFVAESQKAMKRRTENRAGAVSFISQRVVTGRVTDEQGNPLEGVTVHLKNTETTTTTNATGTYQITVSPADARLVFSIVGFEQLELAVTPSGILNAVMIQAENTLDEVVVISYGTQKRELVTGAISSVSAKDLEKAPATQIGQQLQGRLPGVRINQSSGTPGEGISFRIRGQASIAAGNAPLVVIDGFASSTGLEALSPVDIESISVLKDASATALYGSRAANGVILVTTKQAKAGLTDVGVSVWRGFQRVPQRGRPNVMNARQFAQYKNEWYSDQGLEVPERYQNPEQYGPNDGTDWFDVLLNPNAATQNYQLSVSTGTEKVKTAITAGYNKQDGVMLNTFAERFTARANNVFTISPKLTLGLNVASTYRNSQNLPTDGTWNIISAAYIMDPTLEYKNPDGSLPIGFSSPGMFPNPNWYRVLIERENPLVRKNVLVNAFGEYQLLEGLTYKLKADVDVGDSKGRYWSPSTAQGGMFTAPPTPATGSYSTSDYSNWQIENTLNYDRRFNEKHSVQALLGYSAQKIQSESSNIVGSEFPDDEIPWITAAPVRRGDASITELSLLSTFGRLNYAYDDKYLASVSLRRDGSSRFGDEKKFGTFPAVSLGWIASKEGFLQKYSETLSFLKFRASYGEVGNYNIGNYTHLSAIGNSNYAFNDALVAGKAKSNLGNQLLTWETTVQGDVGVDLGLFNDRIFFAYDYYWKTTNGLLYAVDVPLASGFSSIQSNIGEFEFWGHEFSVETKNFIKNFKWNTVLTFSLDRNRVKQLGTENTPIGGYQENVDFIRTAVGHPIGQFYGYVYEGIFMNQDELNQGPHIRDYGGSTIGSVRLKDISGPDGVPDGIIDAAYDKTYIGNPNPTFSFGLTNRLSYRNFDLDIHMVGRIGGDLFMGELLWTENLDGVFNARPEVANRWRSEDNPGDGVFPRTNSNPLHRFNNSHHIYDGSYLAARNISLGYTFQIPPNGTIKSARLYVNAQNAFIITNYPGMNPEASESGLNGLNEGRDFAHYPIPRVFTIGADFKF
ncbi:SusC/RagA family TonB-linked outer membrane protein [Parapedobacter indicus]|uniref:TonB-linked outer membrane protein, SusC/RagA family n=1 Tax=Parapedobacter indicus TaxID=1477437 RepID=A0A1I3DKD7_9SPHI|nr:TonB-dependent receptor [Parapedobacter indicus]PPL04727.1 TonB-linked SusC/RagA family outer membrane protein [Parapedobacter indicus]SFH87187.1 TonB-linked outer membrane protein, SusC/RagA family [Parapedobacter indicus]